MAPWLQRLITIATAIACFVVGKYVPAAASALYPVGIALAAWAIPHTADVKSLGAPIPDAAPEMPTVPIVPPKKAA